MGCRLSHSSSTEDNNNHHQPVDDDDGQQLTVTSHKRPHRFFRRDKPSTTTPTVPTTTLSTEDDDDYSIILTSGAGCNRSSSGTIRSPSNNAVLSRRDTPAIGSMVVDNRVLNGTTAEVPVSTTTTFDANFEDRLISDTTTAVCTKPIGQSMESESQADFFRMLDEKIAHGADYELDIMR